jgi:zinc/manganese transport system permease protein
MFELMFPALVASLVILSIHGYLGIHIIARGVIFVDLALAQVAALGWAAAGLGLGPWLHELIGIPEGAAAYAVGLVFTLLAAALISVSRSGHKFVPHEAIIGIIYVVATAGTILVAAQAPRGSEHVEQLLTGTLLWVTWPEIAKTAAIYLVIGGIHWGLRKRFFLISLDPAAAQASNFSVRKWDFLFYETCLNIVFRHSTFLLGYISLKAGYARHVPALFILAQFPENSTQQNPHLYGPWG